jgi:protein ImuB
MQWLAIHLPLLPLEAFGRGTADARPLALAERQGGAQRVRLCTPEALALGIRPGQGVAAARALCAELLILERQRGAELRALEGLAQWAGQFTSQLSLKPPRGLLLEVGGSLRLFGGGAALQETVRQGLTALGHRARLVQAPTPKGALLLARSGREGVLTSTDELRAALHPLPLGALPLRREQRAALRGMGVDTLGALLRLPTAGLGRRLGREFLCFLERLLGTLPDPQPPFVPPPHFAATLELVTEVTQAPALLFAGRRLLLALGGYLTARQLGVQRLAWRLEHAAGEASRFDLGTLHPEGGRSGCWPCCTNGWRG